MNLNHLSAVITRELATMRDELLAYENESDVWEKPEGISNPTGNLALHVAGNLRHFIGATLGGTGYVRDRDAEFSSTNPPVFCTSVSSSSSESLRSNFLR